MAYLTHASILLLFLLALLVVLKERRAGSILLALGAAVLGLAQLSDLIALRSPPGPPGPARFGLFFACLVPVVFLLYGVSFRKRQASGPTWQPVAVLLLIGGLFAAGALRLPMELLFRPSPGDAGMAAMALGSVGYWYYLGLTILCVAAMVNLEAVFASIRGANRWRIKFEFLGVGSVLGVHVVSLSQALLYRSAALSWLPVRSGVLVVAALLIAYSRLFRGQSQKVAVSRYVFYRSFTLLAVGVYLLALGLAGQFMRSFRLSLSRDFLLIVAFLAGIAFLLVLFSEEIRRRVRVLGAKHFFAHKHDYREQWLGLSAALARCRTLQETRDAVLEAYHSTFGLHHTALYAADGGVTRFRLAAAQGRADLPASFAPSPGMRGYFTVTGRVLDPTDGEYSATPEERSFFADSGAWLVVPLVAGERIEALALLGPQIAAEKPTYEDFDLMRAIGRQAAPALGNFRLSEELAESREMAAAARVSSFVIHDLKNLAYSFSLMMENAGEHIEEPEFQRDLVKSIQGTVSRMNALIAKLKACPERVELKPEAADLASLARKTLEEVRPLKPTVTFASALDQAPASVDVQEIRTVVLNLLLNACEALPGSGTVTLRSGRRDAEAWLSVGDDGAGMPPAFVQEHLFKPFRTTKKKGLGIGLYQCKQIVEAHGGRIEVASREGEGTVFTVLLPVAG